MMNYIIQDLGLNAPSLLNCLKRDRLVDGRKSNQNIDDLAQCGRGTAKDRGNQIEFKEPDQSPIESTYDKQYSGNNVDCLHVSSPSTDTSYIIYQSSTAICYYVICQERIWSSFSEINSA